MSMTPEELQALNARRGYTPPAAPAEPTAPLYVGGPPPEQGGGRGALSMFHQFFKMTPMHR
jgi:hypothetical protein